MRLRELRRRSLVRLLTEIEKGNINFSMLPFLLGHLIQAHLFFGTRSPRPPLSPGGQYRIITEVPQGHGSGVHKKCNRGSAKQG
jgi:hypothetical protein